MTTIHKRMAMHKRSKHSRSHIVLIVLMLLVFFFTYLLIISHSGDKINTDMHEIQNQNTTASTMEYFKNTIFDNTIKYLAEIQQCYNIPSLITYYPKYWDNHYFTEIYPQSQEIISRIKIINPKVDTVHIDCFNDNRKSCDSYQYLTRIDIHVVKINNTCEALKDFNLTKVFKHSIINISATLYEF